MKSKIMLDFESELLETMCRVCSMKREMCNHIICGHRVKLKQFLLSKIAEAETHMAEIAIEQINAIEGDLMEEEHESLSNLCKYAREEIKEAAIKKIEGL